MIDYIASILTGVVGNIDKFLRTRFRVLMYRKTLFIVGGGVFLGFIFLLIVVSKNRAELSNATIIEENNHFVAYDDPSQNHAKLTSTNIDALNTTYIINGDTVHFVAGDSVQFTDRKQLEMGKFIIISAPVSGDVDGDHDSDAVVILAEETSGEEVIYYVGAAIKNEREFKGTNLVSLDKDLFPQNIHVEPNGLIVVKYIRGMSVGKKAVSPEKYLSQYYHVKDGVLEKLKTPNL